MRILILVASVALAACGASARMHAILTAMVTVDAARDGFLAYDAAHEQDLKNAAKSEAEGHAALGAWREKSDQVLRLITAALGSIKVAATLDDDASVSSMLKAGALLEQTIMEAEKRSPIVTKPEKQL